MLTADYAPARGDVVWIDFNPQSGHEHFGRRPAVILSSVNYNRKVGLALLCPVTTRKKGYPFEIDLPDGFPVSGVILADQVKSLDWRARNVEYACALPPEITETILVKARLLLA